MVCERVHVLLIFFSNEKNAVGVDFVKENFGEGFGFLGGYFGGIKCAKNWYFGDKNGIFRLFSQTHLLSPSVFPTYLSHPRQHPY